MNQNDKIKLIKRINSNKETYILYEIFKIIKNVTNEYTINNNGIFININLLNEDTLNSISHFLDYTEYTNNILEKEKKVINKNNYIEINTNKLKTENKIVKKKTNLINKINSNKKEIENLELGEPFISILKKCKELEKENIYEY
jgi:hypothetical protein